MDYNSTLELIKSRRSLYPAQMDEDKRIPDEDIWKLLDLANYAPNHKLTEPWRFVVFSGEQISTFYDRLFQITSQWFSVDEMRKKNGKFEERKQKVSHVLAIVMKGNEEGKVPIQEEEYATACAVQNIMLGMKPLNIIGYWGTGKAAYSQEMHEFLDLGPNDKCMGWLQLGVPKILPPDASRRQAGDIKEKVVWR